MLADIAAIIEEDVNPYSLAELARAIAIAPRRDAVPVWRAFVRARRDHVVAEARTQRIHVRYRGLRANS